MLPERRWAIITTARMPWRACVFNKVLLHNSRWMLLGDREALSSHAAATRRPCGAVLRSGAR
jgi:hypothetical protein